MPFDARAAKLLQPGQHLTVDEAPGLRLVATLKHRTWTYRFKSPADGLMRQTRLGRWPAMSYAAALAAWERARGARQEGRDLAQERRQERAQRAAKAQAGRYTVATACERFLAAYQATVAPKTYAEAKRLLDRDAEPIAHLLAADVTRADAFGLLDAMRDRPVVAQQLRRTLGAVWDRALDASELPADTPNWWRLVLRGKLQSRGKVIAGERVGESKRVLSQAELGQLLRWLPNFSRVVQDILTLYLWTACRGAEVCAMEAAEVSQEGAQWWWTIPRRKLKMRRNPLTVDLRIPLVGRGLEVVQRRLQANPGQWVFPSIGRSGHVEQKAIGVAVYYHMPYSNTRPDIERPRLTVTHWAPHDLRRSVRTLLSAMRCPDDVAEAMLGHLPPGIQGIYNRNTFDAERLRWMRRLDRKLEDLARAAAAAPGGRGA